MKTRTSFVANSSSSSFIILGEVPEDIFPFKKVKLNSEQKDDLLHDGFNFDPNDTVYLSQFVSDVYDYDWTHSDNIKKYEAKIIPYCDGAHGGPYDDEFYYQIAPNIWMKK